MGISPELTQVIDQFNGIDTNDDETITDDTQFIKMDNFYIDGSTHELKVRPGFLELGQGRWPVGVSYLSRHNSIQKNTILGFPKLNGALSEGVWKRDYDGWINNMQSEVATGQTYAGRVTTSAFYIDKEYFFGPGMSKDITWAIDLAANNSGGASNTTVDIYIEQSSYQTSLQQDEANNPSRAGVGVYTASTLVQTDTVTGIIAAVGSNVYKTYTGTLTLNAQCYWARLSIRLTNAADPIGNKRIRVRNPSMRSTNYSIITNRIFSGDFRDFTHNWSRRVVTPSSNPTNEITISAGNLATQTTCTVTDLGSGAIEMYPDVVAKTSNLVNVGVEVTTTPIKYFFDVYTNYMNFNTFSAPPFQGVHVFKDRVWGFQQEENRLWFSDIGAPESWPTVNFIDIGESDEKITGLYGFNDKLIIFKDSSVWFLYVTASTTTWNLRVATTSFGCSSQYTIKQDNGYIYFVGVRGAVRTNGSEFEDLSENLKNVFDQRRVESWNTNFDHAGFWRGHYIISLKTNSNENVANSTVLYCYNTKFKLWYTWTPSTYYKLGYFIEEDMESDWGPGLIACATEQLSSPSASQRISRLVILPEDIFSRKDLNQCMLYADSDNPYDCTLYTKSFTFDDPVLWKKIKWSDLIAEGNVRSTFQSIVDGNTSVVNTAITQELNTNTSTSIPGPSPIKSLKTKINAICKSVRLHYVLTPRLPLGFSHNLTTAKFINNYESPFYNVSVGSLPYETARPLLPDGYGYRMAPFVASNQKSSLITPYIKVLPLVTCTIAIQLSQLASQAGNTRFISYEQFDASFTSLGTTIVENNSVWAGVTDTLTYTPTMLATAAYIRITITNNKTLCYWYIQSISVTPNIAGETNLYERAKISVYSIRMYLHKMRTNIKALT